MTSKKVFISYSHDSDEHAEKVAGLAASLRDHGVDCQIDRYLKGSPKEGWPLWMEKKIEWADFVLVVCTETYLRRLRKEEKPGKGHGATWEAHLIYLHLYEGNLFNAKFVPVVFDSQDQDFIAPPLRSGGHFILADQAGYDDLYVKLTGQYQPAPGVGKIVKVAQRQTEPLFDKPDRGIPSSSKPELKAFRLTPPKEPYPFLRPYDHPATFGGREDDVAALLLQLSRPVPITGLYGTSGCGKSSLLQAGLIPALSDESRPCAYIPNPAESGLGSSLLRELLLQSPEIGDQDWKEFVVQLLQVRQLGSAPVLILDQFEDVLRVDDPQARARVGALLASTVRASSSRDPLCHWVLSYRHESQGRVQTWLRDVLKEARRQKWTGLEELPKDLSNRDRFQHQILDPLGAARYSGDGVERSQTAFLTAITKPLSSNDGPFPITFVGDGADRLSQAFAEIRQDQDNAPLVPELQVVLHDMLRSAGWPSSQAVQVNVPDDVKGLIDGALERHLKSSLEEMFPEGTPKSKRQRALVLLTLHLLTTLSGEEVQRNEGRPEASLQRSLGDDGARLLQDLAGKHRLIYSVAKEEEVHYLLAHDRLAEVVSEEMDKLPFFDDWLDRKVVRLHRIIEQNTRLFHEGEKQEATHLQDDTFTQIEELKDELISNEDRVVWWQKCGPQTVGAGLSDDERSCPRISEYPAVV